MYELERERIELAGNARVGIYNCITDSVTRKASSIAEVASVPLLVIFLVSLTNTCPRISVGVPMFNSNK